MSWNTATEAKALWADAGALDDTVLTLLLSSANEDCFAYLDPVDGVNPPAAEATPSMKLAEIYQARARYNAVKAAGDAGQVGVEGMAITVFPLDWQVQQLLRPKHGRPSIA